ncbi:hypothetical protein F5B19DRAFT_210405 [Rostrohypoxylon terebratum]|nr:hypothetical protein F5B19DRAFT_210405 [Rostrohypoxylon terebratum]
MSAETSGPPFRVLYSGPNERIEIDIVTIHGLGSNAEWAWTWKGEKGHVNWLRDSNMLPAVIPYARIITYNYESQWHINAPKTRLELCGEHFVKDLDYFRRDERDRPLLIVAHSLGGLVVIHGLLHANCTENLKYIPRNTAGFLALGTPFRGTEMQSLAAIVTQCLKFLGSHDGLTADLNLDNDHLADKVNDFCVLKNQLGIPSYCFFELLKSDYGKKDKIPGLFKKIIVQEASAHIPGWGRVGLNTDHF